MHWTVEPKARKRTRGRPPVSHVGTYKYDVEVITGLDGITVENLEDIL